MAGEIADDGVEQIGGGHHPFKVAVFIVDQRHRDVRLLEQPQGVHCVELIGDHFGLAHQPGDLEPLSSQQNRQHFFDLDHPDDVVRAAIGNRQQRMHSILDRGADLGLAGAAVDRVELGPGGHQFAHRAGGEPHDPGHDLALFFLDHARTSRLGEDQMQFFSGQRVFAFGPHADNSQQKG